MSHGSVSPNARVDHELNRVAQTSQSRSFRTSVQWCSSERAGIGAHSWPVADDRDPDVDDFRTLTPEQVAQVLGCSVFWVRERARLGEVEHLRFGHGRVMFRPAHVEQLLKLATQPRRTKPENARVAAADLDGIDAIGLSPRSRARLRQVLP